MSDLGTLFAGIRADFPPMVTSGLDAGCDVDGINEDGMSPLFLASFMNRTEISSLLIQRGANIDFRFQQMTPLMLAAQEGHVDVARILLDAGADVNASSDQGMTSLMIAIRDGHVPFVELLLTYRVDLEAKTQNGSDAMDVAIQFERKDIIPILKRAAGLDPGGFVEQIMRRTANIHVDESDSASQGDEPGSTS